MIKQYQGKVCTYQMSPGKEHLQEENLSLLIWLNLCLQNTLMKGIQRHSANEDVGVSGRGKCLLCQWPLHQSPHESLPSVNHGLTLCLCWSQWSLREGGQGGHPSLVSGLLTLHVSCSLGG